jgi:hypothetical protein
MEERRIMSASSARSLYEENCKGMCTADKKLLAQIEDAIRDACEHKKQRVKIDKPCSTAIKEELIDLGYSYEVIYSSETITSHNIREIGLEISWDLYKKLSHHK